MHISLRHRILLCSIPFIIAGLSWLGVLHQAREGVSDLLFSRRSVPSDIVILAIDEQSIHEIGQWPWPRATFGTVLAQLDNARVIGFDINFKESSRLGSADDRAFADAMRRANVPVVLASEYQVDGSIILPISSLALVSTQGLANVTVDRDGIVRAIQVWRGTIPVFANEIARVSTKKTAQDAMPLRIRYVGPGGTVPSFSFIDVLRGQVPRSEFEGKIVLVGATVRDLQDYDQTPLGLMSGVEIQSNILENILHDDFLRTSSGADTMLTLVVGLTVIFFGMMPRRTRVLFVVSLAMVAVVWIGIFIFFDYGLLLDLVMPTISIVVGTSGVMLTRYLATARERKFIHDTFSRYLAPQIINELISNPSKVRLGGEKRELTILFSDIRGFTTLSESMGPHELAQFLNRYLGQMTDIILDRRGVIDKYIGDAIMAFWGAPLDDADHALNGIRSALAMVAGLEDFNARGKTDGVAPIAVGIGLNTGSVTVGNMGSEKRFDYTVIGDEVNLASRLESLTKTYGVAIIVSANVLNQVPEGTRKSERIVSREIDRVRVKGKHQPVVLHEVMSPAVAARLAPHLELFERGLSAYYEGCWQEAIGRFDLFISAVGQDGPTALLRQRCQEFLTNTPPAWDGAYEMQHK